MSTATSKLRGVLHTHEVFYDSFDQNIDCWGCICNHQTGYYSRAEVIEKHILPIVREAAMEEAKTKLARIFTKAGLDLETILKSEETFGKEESDALVCDNCQGTGIHWYNPDYPIGDHGARVPEPCMRCGGKGV